MRRAWLGARQNPRAAGVPPMPAPSTRIATLTGAEGDGWEIFYRARAMKAAGEPVLELTIGEHDVRTRAPDPGRDAPRGARRSHRLCRRSRYRAAQGGGGGAAECAARGRLWARERADHAGRTGGPFSPPITAACDEGDRAAADRPLLRHLPRHDPRRRCGARAGCPPAPRTGSSPISPRWKGPRPARGRS